MKNNVLIATALNDHARIYLLDSTLVVETARNFHDLWPTSSAALGRTLSVTGLMGLMQKNEEEAVTVAINGGGPIGTILCVSKANGEVKGFCSEPHIYETYPGSHKLAVGLAVGTDGYLKVTKNLKLKQNYNSQVKLQSGEIGDDFAYYFSISEQIPSIVSVGVLVDVDDHIKAAGAMIIELLPGHTEEDIRYLENLNLRPISTVLSEDRDLHKYLYSLFPNAQIREEKQLIYKCDCSRERFLRNLLTLPKKDILELIEEGDVDIHCEFCEKDYHFDREDLKVLLDYVDRKQGD